MKTRPAAIVLGITNLGQNEGKRNSAESLEEPPQRDETATEVARNGCVEARCCARATLRCARSTEFDPSP